MENSKNNRRHYRVAKKEIYVSPEDGIYAVSYTHLLNLLQLIIAQTVVFVLVFVQWVP